jgi:2-desacetyl-2-hydroxyethyl bacteriochlorophyllide A dehydrogenase
MRAAVLQEPGRFTIEEKPRPEPGPGEILVETGICGVCTGEVDQFAGAMPGLDFPRFIGHEVAGTVVGIGKGVNDPREGDRVVLYAERGGYAEYVAVPAAWAVKLKETTPFHLALGEPIACSVNGVRRADPGLNDSVCIVGCGFMGLIMLQVFKARGAGLVVALDRRDEMLRLAESLGATHSVNPDQTDAVGAINDLTDGRGVDIGVEAAGNQHTLDLASKLVRMEGKLEIFGFHVGGKREVDIAQWNWMAFQLINGHTRSPHIYVEGIRIGMDLLESGKLNMDPLVTHRFPLDEINQGFRTAASKSTGFVKAVIDFS